MRLGRAGLVREDESGTNPDGAGAHHQGRSQHLAVVDAASRHDLNGLAGQGAGVALADVDDGRDQHRRGDITSVAATLAALGADDVAPQVEALLDVLGVPDHVHVDDAGLVEPVDDGLGGHTDSRNKQLSAGLDDDVDKLIELALGVVVAVARDMV